MEDFDYIDALAKSELSNRTAVPSKGGWNDIQGKMKRKKRSIFFVFIFLFALLGSFGIYQGINFNSDSDIENNSVTNKNLQQIKSGNNNNSNNSANTKVISTSDLDSTSVSDATSDSTLISKNNTSQAGTDTSATKAATNKQPRKTSNTVSGNENGIVETKAGINSKLNNEKNKAASNNKLNSITNSQNKNQFGIAENDGDEAFLLENVGVKLFPWELITPETLKKKRKKKSKKAKATDFSENLDLMVGLNGFFTSNNYEISKSYVIEVSYTKEKKLKNNYSLNYGAALQFRNLRFKNDSISFNSGELSLNINTNIEKRFGNFGIEAGAYLGYEIYSPNNELFNNINANFFEQKINYGLATALNYKKIALVFKYELSPYIDYLGNKKYGGFIIGVKYDF
ncbi:hypothetical protein H2O64_19080 [Kordia sp. YSTF-M3]|uniref:Outer membrane protein beta-barrel domain-containing protein n=1 Tax=Kordia aestuariivivens TaxID=2759037 RepID=A0ABR7QE19_9FLAO|nr:hypothetical protein [Kordia aestuariivivens]MBC8756785.1 hypothetical protein [Kordia aestuariivivens]